MTSQNATLIPNSSSSFSVNNVNLRAGFTLIELLVVIAIIGILAALVTASINDSRAKSRDAARVSQLNELETALELYYLDNNEYPDHGTGGNQQLSQVSGLAPDYIRSLPSDPLFADGSCGAAGTNYCYVEQNSNQGYILTTSLEAGPNGSERCHIAINPESTSNWINNFINCNTTQ